MRAPSLERFHLGRARRWRPGHDGPDGGRHPSFGLGFGLLNDLRERRCRVSTGRSRVPRSEANTGCTGAVLARSPEKLPSKIDPATTCGSRKLRAISRDKCACPDIVWNARLSWPLFWVSGIASRKSFKSLGGFAARKDPPARPDTRSSRSISCRSCYAIPCAVASVRLSTIRDAAHSSARVCHSRAPTHELPELWGPVESDVTRATRK